MSISHLSTEQRVQQLQSTVISLLTQVSELSRELKAARTQQERLQESCNRYDFAEDHIDEVIEVMPDLQRRLDTIEDELGIYEESRNEEQPVDD